MQNPQHAIHDSHSRSNRNKSAQKKKKKKAKSKGLAPIFGSGSQQEKKTIQGIENTGHQMQTNQKDTETT